MKEYSVQYSKPNDNRIAVSEWLENITIVQANTNKEAITKFNKSHQYLGTWLILDCWVNNE